MHVTLRRAKGLPSLRSEPITRLIKAALRATARARDGAFRVAHFSIQADHVHLIVEADDLGDDCGLSGAMRSLTIRIALAANKLLRRKRGRVWGDRYHARELTTPAEVRSALVYLLANHLKHGELDVGLIDPCSSGPWFQGWMQVLERPPDPCPVEPAQTWLLDWGWHRGRDYISVGELPRALRNAGAG